MLEKIDEFCESVPAMAIAAVALGVAFILRIMGAEVLFSPSWVVAAICGFPLLRSALENLFWRRKITSDLLISIAASVSLALGEDFAAAEIVFIMALGEILEEKTVRRASDGIRRLLKLTPQTARLIDNGIEKIIPADVVEIGNILRILPGETIPADGKIISGSSSIDQSAITGEPLSADKGVGDGVFCGTINLFGCLDIEATSVGEDSSLGKLIRLVEEAKNSRAPMEKIIDRWAGWLVIISLLTAIITYLATGNIMRAATVLIVFCPCALTLSAPTSIMAAVGRAAKRGVLIKSGEALEKMGKVNCVALDKTGTLTRGKLKISDVAPLGDVSDDELLGLAASVELKSEHPLGRAVVEGAKALNIGLSEVKNFEMTPGKGARGDVNGKTVVCGNFNYLAENGIVLGERGNSLMKKFSGDGKALVLVGTEGEALGIIALSDELRDNADGVAYQLKKIGIRVILLSGDNEPAVKYLAKRANISEAYGNLLPADKVAQIKNLQNDGCIVCMVGD
ncbi:MAG: cation-translocating P-type ATPase, partial [Rickettsiales bacterium]|nr:cation-translocating P-type ATPase [Rickettsiales bacterium]